LPACLAECKESPGIITKKKKKFVSEEYVLSDPDLLHDNGYDQSKWVAENLALDAASRGYPIATYRLGRIGPDSRTGASNTDDFLLLFVKGCLQMKCFPTASTFEFPINMIPANITASRICSISLSDEPASGVYHIGNPDPLDYEMYLEHCMKWDMSLLRFRTRCGASGFSMLRQKTMCLNLWKMHLGRATHPLQEPLWIARARE
jgi:thioester reductase-like protein